MRWLAILVRSGGKTRKQSAVLSRRSSDGVPVDASASRNRMLCELALVLALFPAPSAISAVRDLLRGATGQPLTSPVVDFLPGHGLVVSGLAIGEAAVQCAPAALALVLLRRSSARRPGMSGQQLARDVVAALILAIVAGRVQVLLDDFVAAQGWVVYSRPDFHLDGDALVRIALAMRSAVLEEVIVSAFLLTRLRQLGVPGAVAVALSTLLRVTYHVEYAGGVLGVVGFGLCMATYYQLRQRVLPLVVAHAAWDVAISFAWVV